MSEEKQGLLIIDDGVVEFHAKCPDNLQPDLLPIFASWFPRLDLGNWVLMVPVVVVGMSTLSGIACIVLKAVASNLLSCRLPDGTIKSVELYNLGDNANVPKLDWQLVEAPPPPGRKLPLGEAIDKANEKFGEAMRRLED